MDFEIYEGKNHQNRKKVFLVFPFKNRKELTYIGIKNVARRYFKTNLDHIAVCDGYLLNDELYLYQRRRGSKLVTVAFWI